MAVTFAWQANAHSDQDVKDREKLDRVEKFDRKSDAADLKSQDRERSNGDAKSDERISFGKSNDNKSDQDKTKREHASGPSHAEDARSSSAVSEPSNSGGADDKSASGGSGGEEKSESGEAAKSGSSGGSGSSGSGSSGSSGSGSSGDPSGSGSGSGSGSSGSSGSGSSGSSGSDSSGSGSSGSGSSGGGSSGSGSSGSDGSGDGQGTSGASASLPNAVIERDASGREQRADEVILVGRRDAIDALKSQGFDVLGANRLSTSGEVIARVRVKSGDSVEQTLDRLRAAVPGAVVAPNHVFRPSAGEGRGIPAATRASGGVKGRLGIVDTGVDVAGLHLNRSVLATRSFTGGAYTPREHGSAVAMIAANSGVAIDAADVFAADSHGALYTTAEAAAAAIDWLVDRGAPVINISIQGPDNPVLEKVVRSAIARGVVIVAAAGNSGPAAPPSYPAAYVGVVGVTAVDEQGRIYRRANRGDYISFAAVGVHVPVAGPQSVSGTSYAAPSVAAAVARRHQAQSPDAAARVLVQLRAEAIDLGPPGRDKTFGWGWLR